MQPLTKTHVLSEFDREVIRAIVRGEKPKSSIIRSIKSAGITVWCHTAAWINKIGTPAPEIDWRDNLRWWLEGKNDHLFTWCYYSSNEEIHDAITMTIDETPDEYFTPRQEAVRVAFAVQCQINKLAGTEKGNAYVAV